MVKKVDWIVNFERRDSECWRITDTNCHNIATNVIIEQHFRLNQNHDYTFRFYIRGIAKHRFVVKMLQQSVARATHNLIWANFPT